MVTLVVLLLVVGVGVAVWRRREHRRQTAVPGQLAGFVDWGRDLLAPLYPSSPLSRRALPRRLLRAAEQTVTVGVSGVVVVPTRIRIAVNPADIEPFTDAMEWLRRDLAEALRQKATANGWVVPDGPHVEIFADDERPVRLPRASGRFDAFRPDDIRTLHRSQPPGDQMPAPPSPSPSPPPAPEPEAEPEPTGMTSMVVAENDLSHLGDLSHLELPTVAEAVSIHVRLVSEAGPADGGERDLNALLISTAPLVVGRSREADLQVKDGRVSGRHCSLSLDPATRTVLVHDQSSTNGTFVDDQRVDEATLTTGSTLRIGGSSWRVELDQVTP